jgi:photosystem II stability/assembly factor-like uncharacterized protein
MRRLLLSFFVFAALSFFAFTTTSTHAQWVKQTTSTQQSIKSLFVFDTAESWAVGAGATLLHTTNGGVQWSPVTTGIQGNYSCIAYADAIGANGFIVGDMPRIVMTTDFGTSWNTVQSGTTSALNSIFFPLLTFNVGWAVGASGTIVATTDNGLNWSKQTSTTVNNLNGLFFSDDAFLGLVIGDKGTFLFTTDKGSTWVPQSLGATVTQNLNAIDFADNNNGWIVGDQIILHTTDAGISWTKQPFTNPTVLHAIWPMDPMTAYAAGANGRFLGTTDAGAHWVDTPTGSTANILSMQFANYTDGWASGDLGTILASNPPTSGVEKSLAIANVTALAQNYPNPVEASTTFSYFLSERTNVSLKIYDLSGREIATLASGEQAIGNHSVNWNLPDLRTGVYLYRLQAGETTLTKKLLVLSH